MQGTPPSAATAICLGMNFEVEDDILFRGDSNEEPNTDRWMAA